MMSERHGVPSEPEGGGADSPSPLHGPASSSFKCCLPGTSARALFLLGDALPCLEGKLPRSPFWTPAWVSTGAGGPGGLLPRPALAQLSICSPFSRVFASGLVPCPTSFYRCVVPGPWVPGPHVWVRGPASAPSPDTEADTGPQCCPNERGLVGSVGCFPTSPIWTHRLLLFG